MIKNIFEFNNDYVNGTYNSINLKHKSKAIKGFEDFSRSNRVSWTGPDEQNDRFKELLKIGVSNGDTILDFGCGLGALYGYTRKNKLNVKYIGVDINDNYIKYAKKYYNVKLKNIMNFGFNDIKFYTINDYNDIKERFDWFLSSGSFTLGFTMDEIIDVLKWAYEKCNKGIAFNLLGSEVIKQHLNIKSTYGANVFNPKYVLDELKKVFNDVRMTTSYTESCNTQDMNVEDYTFYVKKNN